MAYYQFYKWKKYNGDGTDTGVSLIGNIINSTSYQTLADCQAALPWEPGDVVMNTIAGTYTQCDYNGGRIQDITAFENIGTTTSYTGTKSIWNDNTSSGDLDWIWRDLITGATDSTIHHTVFPSRKYGGAGYIDADGDYVFIDDGKMYYTKYPSVEITRMNNDETGNGATNILTIIKNPNTVLSFWKKSGTTGKIIHVSITTIDWTTGTKDIEYDTNVTAIYETEIETLYQSTRHPVSININRTTMKGTILTVDTQYSDTELKIWDVDLNNFTFTDSGHVVTGLIASSHSIISPICFAYVSPTNNSIFRLIDGSQYVVDPMNRRYITFAAADTLAPERLYKYTVAGVNGWYDSVMDRYTYYNSLIQS